MFHVLLCAESIIMLSFKYRFKKRMLIEQLESFLEEIHRRSNQVNHINST